MTFGQTAKKGISLVTSLPGKALSKGKGLVTSLPGKAIFAYDWCQDNDVPRRVGEIKDWYFNLFDGDFNWKNARKYVRGNVLLAGVSIGALALLLGKCGGEKDINSVVVENLKPKVSLDQRLDYDERAEYDENISEWNKSKKVSKAKSISRKDRVRPFKIKVKPTKLDDVIKNEWRSEDDMGWSIAKNESDFVQDTVSSAGAVGYMGIRYLASKDAAKALGGAKKGFWPFTYPYTILVDGKKVTYTEKNPCPDMTYDWRFDPRKNIKAGHAYFKQMKREFRHDDISLAAYNWGPGNVRKIVKILKEEGVRNPKYEDVRPYMSKKARRQVDRYVKKILGDRDMFDYHPPLKKHTGITDGYAWRRNPVTRKREFHDAYDISAPKGTPIYAMASGTVSYAGRLNSISGKSVIIDHDDSYFQSRYLHIDKINGRLLRAFKKGKPFHVRKGQRLGTVGRTGRTTGNHLHCSVYQKVGKRKRPVDWIKLYARRDVPDYNIHKR